MAKAVPALPGMGDVASQFNEIETLQAEVRKHISAIQDLYARIAKAAGGFNGRVGRRPRGRPRGRPARAAGEARPRKRAKRGALRAAIHKILAGGKTMGCSQVVAALQKAGYRTASEPKVFYNTVYLGLKNDKGVEKTANGFRLKTSAK